MGTNLIEHRGEPVLFYASDNQLFRSALSHGVWSPPEVVLKESPAASAASLDQGIGLAFIKELQGERSIFFRVLPQ